MTAKSKHSVLSIKLNALERSELEKQAAGQPLSTYIKSTFMTGNKRKLPNSPPLPDHTKLAQVLAALGKSQLAPSLQTLAQEAANGSLYVDEDVTQRLFDAFNQIAAIHFCLLTALGKRPEQPMNLVISLRHKFGQAADGEAGP